MGPLHSYSVVVDWTGAGDRGTESYTSYGRDHVVQIEGKPPLPGSADLAFRGDADRYSPEDLFVAALAQCHMLWFLHKAAMAGVVVTGYTARPPGRCGWRSPVRASSPRWCCTRRWRSPNRWPRT